MIKAALLALCLGSLTGCFFSLDGSLVDKKRDAGPRRDAVSEGKLQDRSPRESAPVEAGTDLQPDRFTSKVDHRPQGG